MVVASLMAVILPSATAFFTLDHEYWTLNGFKQVDSQITAMCRDRLEQVIDGNAGNDVPVLHYFDEKFMSYISTHTKGSGYEACLREAGDDIELRCMCIGVGLHIVQDTFAHTQIGLVPKYLKKYAASNLVGHMTVEHDFEKKHIQYLTEINDPIVVSGQLDYYDKRILCSFFEPSDICPDAPGDPKYYQLLNEMSGIDVRNDLNIFQSGYLGNGFYNTVYNEKLRLPFWFWGLSIGLVIVGLGLAAYVGITAKNNWRWVLVAQFILLFALPGALILGAFYTNSTWKIVEGAMDTYLATGMLRVSDTDVQDYNRNVQEATNYFLGSGKLVYEDASGLSYCPIGQTLPNGQCKPGMKVQGALYSAEKAFMFGLFPALVLVLLLLNAYLFTKAYEISWGFGGGMFRK